MFERSTKLVGLVGILVTALFLTTGVAGAKNAETSKDKETKTSKQEVTPEGAAKAGSWLEEVRGKPGGTGSRTRSLDRRTRNLQRNLEDQREDEKDSRGRLEESAKSAYRGKDLEGVTLMLEGLINGDGTKLGATLGGSEARALTRGRDSIRFRQDSQQALEDTTRKLDQKKKQRARIEESRRREAPLETRIAELEAADQAGAITMPPASGSGGPVTSERELEIAQEDIVVRPVEPIPYERYVQIYKASAKRYGFTKDWYVLAAVGKIESDHGANMGPSSAGAMGPMQFLPSTWSAYGVDGNKDGVANIMDPEDAIPSAAAYLKDGGAPEDWDAALYVYNRSSEYVREVLDMAEGYRELAEDDKVEPYV